MLCMVIQLLCWVWWWWLQLVQPFQTNPIFLCSTCLVCYWKCDRTVHLFTFNILEFLCTFMWKLAQKHIIVLNMDWSIGKWLWLTSRYFFSKFPGETRQVVKNLSEYIRFKSGTYELVYYCLRKIIQLFSCVAWTMSTTLFGTLSAGSSCSALWTAPGWLLAHGIIWPAAKHTHTQFLVLQSHIILVWWWHLVPTGAQT